MRWTLVLTLAGASLVGLAYGDDKVAEPTPQQQAESEKLVKDVYKEDYAKRGPDERRALAAKLLEEGKSTKSDTNSQFVLLREARDMAVQVGDLTTAMDAIDEIGKLFTSDTVDMRLKALVALQKAARTPEVNVDGAAATMRLMDDAMASESFEMANKAAELAVQFATSAKNMQLVADVQAKKADIKAQSTAYLEMKIASDKLKTDANDTQAKFMVGMYLALYKSDWDKGLALMAEGSDPAWAAASKADIANPVDVGEMVKVADAWWDLAQKPAQPKNRLLARAEFWYNLIQPNADGLVRSKVEKRLDQIAATKTGNTDGAVSDATRKLLPTPSELAKIKEVCLAIHNGNNMKSNDLYQMLQTTSARLSQDIQLCKEADFLARCKADLDVRKLVEANAGGMYVNMYAPVWNQFHSYAVAAKSKEEFAGRALAYERFMTTNKLGDSPVIDNWMYNVIRNYTVNNQATYGTPELRKQLCAYLKTKGVKSGGVDRYLSSVYVNRLYP